MLLSFSSLASIAQLEQQAQLNNAEAQYRLGLAYETGEGVRRDLSLAAHWYQQASENGHRAATYNYAQALEYGRGIKSNPAKAVLLYTKLAAEGDPSTYGKIARFTAILISTLPTKIKPCFGMISQEPNQPSLTPNTRSL